MQDPSTKDLKTCQPWSCPKNQLSWQTHQIDRQILVLRPRTKQFILYSSCFLWSFSFFFSQQITPYHPYHFLYPCSLHAPSIILTASFAIFSLSKNHSPPYLNSQTRTYVEVCMKWKKICTLTPLIPFICPRTQSHHCYEKLLYVILVCYTQQLLYSYLNLV